MPDAVELRNTFALQNLELQGLIRRGVESDVLLTPHGFDAAAADIIEFVTNEQQFMIVGAEDGHFKGIVMGVYPNGHLFPYPTVFLFYNEGSRAMREKLKEVLLDTVFKRGYTSVTAINGSKRPDRAWEKVFGMDKTTLNRVGSLYKIDIK